MHKGFRGTSKEYARSLAGLIRGVKNFGAPFREFPQLGVEHVGVYFQPTSRYGCST